MKLPAMQSSWPGRGTEAHRVTEDSGTPEQAANSCSMAGETVAQWVITKVIKSRCEWLPRPATAALTSTTWSPAGVERRFSHRGETGAGGKPMATIGCELGVV